MYSYPWQRQDLSLTDLRELAQGLTTRDWQASLNPDLSDSKVCVLSIKPCHLPWNAENFWWVEDVNYKHSREGRNVSSSLVLTLLPASWSVFPCSPPCLWLNHSLILKTDTTFVLTSPALPRSLVFIHTLSVSSFSGFEASTLWALGSHMRL